MSNQIQPAPPRFVLELERDPGLRSPHTRIQYRSNLTHFMEWLNGRRLSLTLAEEYIATLQNTGASIPKVKQVLAVIRWWTRRVIKIAFDELPQGKAEEVERNLTRVLSIPDPKGSNAAPLPAGRHLESGEIDSLLAACQDGTIAGYRDCSMIAIASGTGLRNEELRTLTLGDIEFKVRNIIIDGKEEEEEYAQIKIRHGKGDKPRIVEIFGENIEILTRWIEKRGAAGRYLFPRILKNGRVVTDSPLSYEGTRLILKKRFLSSPLSKSLSWHDFRRTVVGQLFSSGVDISTIMLITGHQEEKTTRRYDRRPEERRLQALKEIQNRNQR